MSYPKDLTGQTFGYLTAIEVDKSPNNKRRKWICKCKCGNYTSVTTNHLTSGDVSSCGCKNYESKNKTHGLSHTRIYEIWCGIRRRCYNQKDKNYSNYGGRGITVCNEWNADFMSFYNWSVANGYNDNLTIDRINNNGNYEPQNCRWITHAEQQRNRSFNIFITHGTVTKTISQWARITGMSDKLFYDRYKSTIKHKGKCTLNDLVNPQKYKPIYTEAYYGRNHFTKKVAQYTKDGTLLKIWDSVKSTKSEGFNPQAVSTCAHGKSKSSGGYIWKYVN